MKHGTRVSLILTKRYFVLRATMGRKEQLSNNRLVSRKGNLMIEYVFSMTIPKLNVFVILMWCLLTFLGCSKRSGEQEGASQRITSNLAENIVTTEMDAKTNIDKEVQTLGRAVFAKSGVTLNTPSMGFHLGGASLARNMDGHMVRVWGVLNFQEAYIVPPDDKLNHNEKYATDRVPGQHIAARYVIVVRRWEEAD